MAVTVISRPLGHKLSSEAKTGNALDSSGDTYIESGSHGLSEGDYVYIESNIDSYNGFFKVALDNTFPADIFYPLLSDDITDFIPFKQSAEVTFYKSDLDHGWQCVHLPIVYELESDLYPVNSVDTLITISPYGYVNGYFAVTHSALTGSDELFALDYVELSDGRVLQVVEIVSSTVTVLNFDGVGTISTMQKVRNNYHVLVNVYAGLPVGHAWESEKPYELATTLRFIPDSNNVVKFSIAEILKGYITTRNNLTLDTLPNNIDFMTAFYIEFAEAYDISNGTEVTVFEDEFEEDDFEGYAVNAMLPFKNIYSGWMSRYLLSDSSDALFLTTFDVPSLFENYFFDISILVKEGLPQLYIKKVWYFDDGTISHTEEDEILDFDEGVYRVELEAQCSSTQEVVTTYINSEWSSGAEGWAQGPGSFTDNWGWDDSPDYFGDGTGYVFKPHEIPEYPSFRHSISVDGGQSVRLQLEFGAITDITAYTIEVIAIDQFTGDQYQVAPPYAFFKNSGLGDDFLTIDEVLDMPTDVVPVHFNQIGFIISGGFGVGNVSYVNYFRLTSSETVSKNINKVIISITDGGSTVYTEEKTINVICECGDTFVNDDLRLIETGPFRELE